MSEERTRPKVEGYKFLDREDYKQYAGYFRQLTAKIGFIGDIDLLTTARQDMELIEKAGDGGFEKAADAMLGIIGSGSDHTLLAKVRATMKYCDLTAGEGTISSAASGVFIDKLGEAIRSEPQQHGSIVLSGALYARLLYHSLGKAGDSGKSIESLHQSVSGIADTKEKEINMLGVVVAANTLAEMFESETLTPRLPVVTIVRSENGGKETGSDPTFPDKTMFLGIGHLASLKKMKEAAVWGMPDNSKFVLTRRLPRVLVGVEVVRPVNGNAENENRIISVKNLVHVNIAPVRVRQNARPEIFETPLYLRRENVLEHASFDSLSYWLAVRMVRELNADPPEQGKLFAASARINNRLLGNLEEITAYFGDGSGISVLSEAVKEYNKWHPGGQISVAQLKKQLSQNATGLGLEYGRGVLGVRQEKEISGLIMEHIWCAELQPEDKIELAKALLEDKDYRYGRFTPQVARNVRLYAAGREELSDESTVALMDYSEKSVKNSLVLRFETIRNKEEPETLLQAVYHPGIN